MLSPRDAYRAWLDSGGPYILQHHPGETKHARLRHSLLQQISALRLKPGDALPSESRLCQLYGVSRSVVRQALIDLETTGVINRHHGKGSFVAEQSSASTSPYTLRGLYTDVSNSSAKIFSDVLTQKQISATAEVAKALRLEPGARVYYLERLRRGDGQPWSWIHDYLPVEFGSFFVDRDMRNESLHTVLAENGVLGLGAHRSVEVSPATQEQQHILGVSDFPVVMVLKSVTFDPANQPISYFTAYHRGDRSRFEFTI